MKYCYLFLIGVVFSFWSCEDKINVKLDSGPSQLVVDGVIYNTPPPYEIKITSSQSYFDNSNPKAINAKVYIDQTDTLGVTTTDTLIFENDVYKTKTTIGAVGYTYKLRVEALGQKFYAITTMGRVPKFTSDSLKFEKIGSSDKYTVELRAYDLVGRGDFYRFKTYRNNILFNKPENLNYTDDELVDGFLFIPPIQFGFNPEPYKAGELVKIEVLSIDAFAYRFYDDAIRQINNDGLFARPPANVPTNILNENAGSSVKALGLFGASAIHSAEAVVKLFI